MVNPATLVGQGQESLSREKREGREGKLLEGMELEVMERKRGISGVGSSIAVSSHGAE